MLRHLLAPTAAALAAAALLLPAPAHAAEHTRSDLVLTWTRYNAVGQPLHLGTLHCSTSPATGQHPDPVAACAALEDADGEPGNLADDGRICTRQYDPVGAAIVGTWEGREVWWSGSYANACEMARYTDGVMAFR